MTYLMIGDGAESLTRTRRGAPLPISTENAAKSVTRGDADTPQEGPETRAANRVRITGREKIIGSQMAGVSGAD
jgi:hypothetical protein